jgi:hypothetical protein
MENLTINKLELASELADQKLKANWSESIRIYEDDEAETLVYTEESQDIFNEYYEEFLNFVEEFKTGPKECADLNEFLEHIQDSANEMLEQMDEVQPNEEFWGKYAYTITSNGKSIKIDINADTFSRMEAFVKSEINHLEE